ncbi:MAG TPA: hypothetical protein VLJ42_02495 [Solirubrobacteraceae bacterium]|nr:hypothetical protein [Solirubrobacteraceae bacterium]
MDTWTFIWLMVFMKIPIVGLLLLVRWAVSQTPEDTLDEDGGISHEPRPRHPHHPRPRLPRSPRRGPHRGAPAPVSPLRTRTALARARAAQHR